MKRSNFLHPSGFNSMHIFSFFWEIINAKLFPEVVRGTNCPDLITLKEHLNKSFTGT